MRGRPFHASRRFLFPEEQCGLWVRASFFAVICLLFLPARASSADPSESCAVVEALNTVEWQQLGMVQQKARPPLSREELRRPMTEKELRQLILALEPIEKEKGKGLAPRAFVEGTALGLERLSVLLGIVTALLADLHAAEALERLRNTTGVEAEALAWAEKFAAAIHACVEAQFAALGGAQAYARALDLVKQHRVGLESALAEFWGLQSPRPWFAPGGER